MVDPITRTRMSFRLFFVLLVCLLAFIQVLPFSVGDRRWPLPDLVTLLAFAWVMRRPDYVPAILVGVLVLLGDILFMRPPGLWAALVVIGLEFLRAREHLSRDLPFLVEWMLVATVLLFMTLGHALILAVFLVDQPVPGLTFMQLIVSAVAYPLVVAVSRFVLGIRKMAPGEADALGYRL
ncbi:rod shape-determining protein MreD [Oceaniovalibus sp. ACAM 378]|uniref:rod shape-determining protein MreD n=1 Tax=Oceaniovalibus sp. ACAM 378 TaxID=2599923 RepID=UPI0011D64608|nr:rod shape-determining protein MreD [Oceaniovalibus sp. ACAM 378]TYB85547.1 rod shape-determining protein MreD [Oceaniovalibus sp. ACAM 378]